MAFQRPSLAELDRQARADIESRLPGTDTLLRRSFVRVFARVIAGGLYGLYAFLGWIERQMFDASADEDGVLRRAAELGIVPVAAKKATGAVTVTGTIGTVIPVAGPLGTPTTWRSGNGTEYRATAVATLVAGTADVPVTAAEAGAAGNADAGTKLSLVSPIAGVQSQGAAAAGGIAGGADREGVESVRRRLIARRQSPPGVGKASDYERWAREAHQDITGAWTLPLGEGLGDRGVWTAAGDLPTLALTTVLADDAVNLAPVKPQEGLGAVFVLVVADGEPPRKARGKVRVTGTNGTDVPVGTEWKKTDDATVKVVSTGAALWNEGAAEVDVEARAAGEAGNIFGDQDTSLTKLGSAISGLDAAARTVGDITGGVEAGTPTAAHLAAVDAYLQSKRPISADVTIAAPRGVPLNLTASKLVPNTAAVQAEAEAEVAALIWRERAPGGTIPWSHLDEALSAAEGETDHTLTPPPAKPGATPPLTAAQALSKLVTREPNEIAVPGTITWPLA